MQIVLSSCNFMLFQFLFILLTPLEQRDSHEQGSSHRMCDTFYLRPHFSFFLRKENRMGNLQVIKNRWTDLLDLFPRLQAKVLEHQQLKRVINESVLKSRTRSNGEKSSSRATAEETIKRRWMSIQIPILLQLSHIQHRHN